MPSPLRLTQRCRFLLWVLTGLEGRGSCRAPISPQQPRKEEAPLKVLTLEGDSLGPGVGVGGLRASFRECIIAILRGVKRKARGKMKAKLSVLG